MQVKVEGTTFIRDIKSMALSNIDEQGKNEYHLKRELLQRQKNEINIIKDEIGSLKEEMSEIKQMLKILIEK